MQSIKANLQSVIRSTQFDIFICKKTKQQTISKTTTSYWQENTTLTNSPSHVLGTQTDDFLYLTAWMQARWADKSQGTDCSFSSSSMSNKRDQWRLNTLLNLWWKWGRVTDFNNTELAFPTQYCKQKGTACRSFNLVLFKPCFSITLVCLRTTGDLQHS